MDGGVGRGRLCYDLTLGSSRSIAERKTATDPGGGGGVSPPGSVVMFDTRTPVTAWTGAHPCRPRVSVVLVEETPGRSARKLPSTPDSGKCQTIAGAAPPAGVADIVDSVWLPTIARAAPPADVAKVVAADAASLADAGILTKMGRCPNRPCWDTVPG